MRLPTNLLLAPLLAAAAAWAQPASPWPQVLASIGMPAGAITVNRPVSDAQLQQGAFLVITGESPLASSFGFSPQAKRVRVQSIIDARAPALPMIWEKSVDLPFFETPPGATIFARDRWTQAPVLAGFRKGRG
ncbi:MAG TPA: hypothetical protein VMZ52_01015, partial [Bryobacteraceae bacterium]|nr:hypothetical protein [Bryobacteraceae bacterium]